MGGGGCCVGDCCVVNLASAVNAVKRFFGFGSSGSDSGGRTESYDSEKASLEATVRVQAALTEFKTDTQSRSGKLEDEILKASRESLDSFIDDLKKYNKVKYGNQSLNINIEHIQRENRKTEDLIHGFIVKRVAKRISLDDSECSEILKLSPGKEKTQKLDEFYKKVLREAVSELSKKLREIMEDQTDTVEDRIQQRIDSIVDLCEAKQREFSNMKDIKSKDESEMEQQQMKYSHFIAVCECGLSALD